MSRSSWRPKLRSMLLASVVLGAMAGSLNSYFASVNAQQARVCTDAIGTNGQICYTTGCYCANGKCTCGYVGSGCPTRSCQKSP